MRIDKRSAWITAAAAALFVAAWSSGIKLAVNTSPSMPRGLYVMHRVETLERDALVAICLPDGESARTYLARDYIPHGRSCQSGAGMLLKPLVGVPGDEIDITAAGVVVNGVLVPHSRVFDEDSQGRHIEHLPVGWKHTLGEGEFFALATHLERSLDSRYYGPVQRSQIAAAVSRLISFETGK